MPKHFHTNDEVNPSDFKRVCFDHSHSFQHDELVLVSRSKGGFSYGYVDTMCSEMKCPYNYQYQHNALYWKVWLYRSETKRVYKVLSAFKIGKLSKVDSIPNKDETELTPDEYKQVLYDEETVLSSTSVVCPSTSGGLVHCIVVGPQALKCHCFDHQIDGLSVDYGTTTSVLPLSAVGVILSPENQKKIVIDGANIAYSNSNGKVFEVGVLKSVITYYEKRKYQPEKDGNG
ncbi:hypothetical protein EIN_315380 [Entamoeba invadens IP1]|uniref:RNase NYN domain-containing protein n=1 Tax=Entamoeba invadens IP1 TaxID=370355 RepID=A0A0A1TZD7_ENTIV|nr:hypothetical protein EIN_315380 [Entamoeba invadens IP1]ELP86929.1 hypothetical protein EIN_315380 [Entamoeba invadens IP1]|eukprot:XP_004253700.1 hypothetical protein EIN_315380 [Entamoeba invadens IP1]